MITGAEHIGLHGVTLGNTNAAFQGGNVVTIRQLGLDTSNSDISITDATFNIAADKTGLKVDGQTDVEGLVVKNSTFNGGRYGLYFDNASGVGDSVSGRFEHLVFTGQTGSASKAIYAEKLSDASFLNIEVQGGAGIVAA